MTISSNRAATVELLISIEDPRIGHKKSSVCLELKKRFGATLGNAILWGIAIAAAAYLEVYQGVLTEEPITSILQSLREGELVNAVLITFLLNLAGGAFLTTTLPESS